MDRTKIEMLLETWTKLDNAARNMQTALPSQMTERAAALESARLAMHSQLWGFATHQLASASEKGAGAAGGGSTGPFSGAAGGGGGGGSTMPFTSAVPPAHVKAKTTVEAQAKRKDET